MSDKPSSYYYKEVEAAIDRFKDVGSSMLPLAEKLNMPDVDVIKTMANFQRIMWSKHPSVINLNLSENELTDDQKEEIALSNKIEFDAAIAGLNEMSDLWESVAKKSDMVEQASITIIDMVLDSVKSRLTYDYHGELNGDYDAIPITLTAEELYWALDLIGTEQARLVLSEQSHQVFDALYNAYQKGVEDFTNTFSNLASIPMKGLRVALRSSIKDTASLSNFIETQLKEDKRLLAALANEVIESEDDSFSKILDYLLCGEPICDLDTSALMTSYGNLVGNSLATASNIDGLSRFDKKQIQSVKESLSNELPITMTDNEEEVNFSTKMLNIVTTLTDKWLVQKIHERAKENTQPKSLGEVKEEKSTKYSMSCERLPAPTRFTDNRIGAQYYEAILRQLYSLYGYNFLDMSEDEFVYFFEGTNKKPSSYRPPYYWNGSAPAMKALLRILYTSTTGETDSSRSFGRLILMPEDKDMGKSYHDWRGKHNLGVGRLTAIEKNLQDIVRCVTGKDLLPIDLNRKYDYADEVGNKSKRKSKKKNDKKDEEAES